MHEYEQQLAAQQRQELEALDTDLAKLEEKQRSTGWAVLDEAVQRLTVKHREALLEQREALLTLQPVQRAKLRMHLESGFLK